MKADINETCICCGTCASLCPVAAISIDEKGNKYKADPKKCIGCGVCISNCPVGAIYPIADEDAK